MHACYAFTALLFNQPPIAIGDCKCCNGLLQTDNGARFEIESSTSKLKDAVSKAADDDEEIVQKLTHWIDALVVKTIKLVSLMARLPIHLG